MEYVYQFNLFGTTIKSQDKLLPEFRSALEQANENNVLVWNDYTKDDLDNLATLINYLFQKYTKIETNNAWDLEKELRTVYPNPIAYRMGQEMDKFAIASPQIDAVTDMIHETDYAMSKFVWEMIYEFSQTKDILEGIEVFYKYNELFK